MKPLGARPLLGEWDWQSAGRCRGMDSSVFFSPPDERGRKRRLREERARLVCRSCPVRIPCAAFALRTAQPYGVWGGLTESDRVAGEHSAPLTEEGSPLYTRILLAADSTSARMAGLDAVVGLARLAGSAVHVLHIATTAVVGTSVVPMEEEQDGREVLDETLKALADAGVEADGELLDRFSGEVAAAISASAERFRADLIVLSPHQRNVVGAWLNPRVSDAVSHATRVPVLLVPAPADR